LSEQFVLDGVGVLVFVDQDMSHDLLPFHSLLRVFTQQLERQTNQVIEVHTLVSSQSLLVA